MAGRRIRMLSAMQFTRLSGFNSIPSATGGIARLACARLDEMGKDPTIILSKVGLTPEEARDPAVRLEVRTQIKLLELAAEEVHDEWLGFHLARSFDLREIGLVYYVIASSDQLSDALRSAERYSQINNEGVRLRFSMQDGAAVIALDYVNVDRDADRHHIEFWLVTLVRICRQVTNGRLVPSRLKTKHLRNRTPAEFRAFFGVDIEFGANADEIWFPRPIALLSLVGRDERLNELLRRYAEEALAQTSPPRRKQEVQMIKLVIRFVTLATLPMALIAAPSFTPASAMDGGGGDPAKDTTNYAWPPSYPPSSHPRQSDIMATHKVKKTTKRSSIRRTGN